MDDETIMLKGKAKSILKLKKNKDKENLFAQVNFVTIVSETKDLNTNLINIQCLTIKFSMGVKRC